MALQLQQGAAGGGFEMGYPCRMGMQRPVNMLTKKAL
jgi:hypothetical protein